MDKAEGAFLTIGELARELGVAQHILRYWETRFSQLKPLQRSGNRRYYRPADVIIARRIDRLLNQQGFTVRGAQRVLDGQSEAEVALEGQGAIPPSNGAPSTVSSIPAQPQLALDADYPANSPPGQIDPCNIALLIARLTVIRENLKEAIGPA